MILAIDASNIILESGGYIHLKQLLSKFKNKKVEKIYVFSSKKIIKDLSVKNKKIIFVSHSYLNKGIFHRVLWQIFIMKRALIEFKCSAILILGGYFFTKKIPTFIILQNLLPFIKNPKYEETLANKIRNYILFVLHNLSIIKSDGIIYLSNFSKKIINSYNTSNIVVPHGVENQFFYKNKNNYKVNGKFKILYLSKLEGYKNHTNIVFSINELLKQGYPITLTLVGVDNLKYKNFKLFKYIYKINKEFPDSIILKKLKKHSEVHKIYREYDLHVFGSMCESFGIILLETIASSLPIVCSNFPVFKEILNKNSLYFDGNNVKKITLCIKKYIKNKKLKIDNTNKLFKRAKYYNWQITSKKTFDFIIKEYEKKKRIC